MGRNLPDMAAIWPRVLSRLGDVLSLASLLLLALHLKWLPLRAAASDQTDKSATGTPPRAVSTMRASTALLLLASALCEGAFMFDGSKTAFKTTFGVFRDLVEADKKANFADSLREFMTALTTKQAVYAVTTSMLCIAASWAVLYSMVFRSPRAAGNHFTASNGAKIAAVGAIAWKCGANVTERLLEPGTLTVLQRLALPLRAVALGYQATAVGEHTPRPELGFLMLQAWSLVSRVTMTIMDWKWPGGGQAPDQFGVLATVLGTSPKAGAALTSAVACLVLAGTLLQHRCRLLLLLLVLGSAALSPPAFNLLWTVQLNPYETLAHVSSCFLLMAVLSAMLNGAPILMALGLVFNVLLRLHQIDAGGDSSK